MVCLIVCGLTCFLQSDGALELACRTYRSTNANTPKRVMGCFRRLRNTASLGGRPSIKGARIRAVDGKRGQIRGFLPFPMTLIEEGSPRSRLAMVAPAASLARAPEL